MYRLGKRAACQGSVAVGAESTWANDGIIELGVKRLAELKIRNGGTVSNTIGFIGTQFGPRCSHQ
jgi:T5SS/PEP-CTERM-associated repeat protein